MLNKQIATKLKIAEKTVKVHRGRVMEKLGANSVAELVRLAEKAGIKPPENK
jgi:FixJ family two-component response regulator